MSIPKRLAVSLIMLSFGVHAELKGTGCVPHSGNHYVDEMAATAIAKGNLSQKIGVTVSANTRLVTVTKEHSNTTLVNEVFLQEINLTSQHRISGIQTVSSGLNVINSTPHYCVELAITR